MLRVYLFDHLVGAQEEISTDRQSERWADHRRRQFSSNPGESDVMMRNKNTGGLEVYDIANNQITGGWLPGTSHSTGSSRVSRRCGPPGESDLVLRNGNTDIAIIS
jgi:hypothetical protein